MRAFSTQRALASLWELVGAANKYVDSSAPWVLAKDPARAGELATVMYELFECIRVIATLLGPFMPETSAKILVGDRRRGRIRHARASGSSGASSLHGTQTRKTDALFPRIETA